MTGLVARAYASPRITGGVANRFRFKVVDAAAVAEMLALVDALLVMRRHPEAILSSMEIMGARVERGPICTVIEFGGVEERSALGAGTLVAFWQRAARRRLRRSRSAQC